LPTSYSWLLQGERRAVPYQAPHGRRVNAIGADFTHGPDAGRFAYQSWAVLPKSRANQPRKPPEERAAAHGLTVDTVGPIDAERVVTFLWQVAGRPADAPAAWQRERPLMIALDNYAVHTSQTLQDARPLLAAAAVHLVYLARDCPEQSDIEPVWNDVKQHQLPTRSFERVAELKHAVAAALARKAAQVYRTSAQSTNVHRLST
jgi:DDE superfamily endonuclease